jgi:hypothetical protein
LFQPLSFSKISTTWKRLASKIGVPQNPRVAEVKEGRIQLRPGREKGDSLKGISVRNSKTTLDRASSARRIFNYPKAVAQAVADRHMKVGALLDAIARRKTLARA